MTLFEKALVAHWVADWILQNEFMAVNKISLRHPAAYVHAGIHLIALVLVFPLTVAAMVAVSHLLIDTRLPLTWWRRIFRQTTEGPMAIHVAIWEDQVAHVLCIALATAVLA